MYQILSDLRDCLQTCFDQQNCNYQFFISLGQPPADCSSVAIWLDSSRRDRSDNAECCTSVYNTNINITITSCCMNSNTEIEFDPIKEEANAECFLDDVCKLRDCLSCDGCTIDSLGCGLVVNSVQYDRELLGTCYSATIAVSIIESCCGAS